MRNLAFAVTVFLAAASNAIAQSTENPGVPRNSGNFMAGADLWEVCRPDADAEAFAACVGFVTGVADEANTNSYFQRDGGQLCMPPGVTARQIAETVI